ncbi:MAG: broad specificity phosphatase PhoE [Alphaproteobacteria bacterium]|jgi:broad specificity phosphatase PhoE
MITIALLRHGPTQWNADGRLQGRRDTKLSPSGRAAVGAWRLPEPWARAAIVASPLQRCLDTIDILRLTHEDMGPHVTDPRLIEMDWGMWEGRTLGDLRHEQGEAMAANEANGLDFRPEGGESPRDVQARLLPALTELAQQGEDRLVVAHRGIIRALYALANGWDMRADPADKLSRNALQIFTLSNDGQPRVAELNVYLSPEPEK